MANTYSQSIQVVLRRRIHFPTGLSSISYIVLQGCRPNGPGATVLVSNKMAMWPSVATGFLQQSPLTDR